MNNRQVRLSWKQWNHITSKQLGWKAVTEMTIFRLVLDSRVVIWQGHCRQPTSHKPDWTQRLKSIHYLIQQTKLWKVFCCIISRTWFDSTSFSIQPRQSMALYRVIFCSSSMQSFMYRKIFYQEQIGMRNFHVTWERFLALKMKLGEAYLPIN